MRVKRISFETYLGRLQQDFISTLSEVPKVKLYQLETVFPWELSYRSLSPAAARLLDVCSFLSNEDIPVKFLLGDNEDNSTYAWMSNGITLETSIGLYFGN